MKTNKQEKNEQVLKEEFELINANLPIERIALICRFFGRPNFKLAFPLTFCWIGVALITLTNPERGSTSLTIEGQPWKIERPPERRSVGRGVEIFNTFAFRTPETLNPRTEEHRISGFLNNNVGCKYNYSA